MNTKNCRGIDIFLLQACPFAPKVLYLHAKIKEFCAKQSYCVQMFSDYIGKENHSKVQKPV